MISTKHKKPEVVVEQLSEVIPNATISVFNLVLANIPEQDPSPVTVAFISNTVAAKNKKAYTMNIVRAK